MAVDTDIKIAFIFDVLEREPFLEQLLLRIIKRFRLSFYIFFDDENTALILNVQGKQKDIRDFSDAFSLEFPTSLVFRFKRVIVLPSDAIIQSYAGSLPSFSSTLQEQRILPQECLQLTENIHELKHFPYKGRVLLEGKEILPQGQEAQYSVVAEIFRAFANKIMQGEDVCMQTLYGMKAFTLNPAKREWTMPVDLAALESFFHVNVAQMEALNSWEKPILFLSLLEPLEDHKNRKTFNFSSHIATVIAFSEAVVMPYDYTIALLIRSLKEQGVDLCYLYTPESDDISQTFRHVFLSDRIIPINPMKICVAKNHQWVNLSKERSVLDCSHYLSAFYKEAKLQEDAAVLHVSYDLPTLGGIINQQNMTRTLNITLQLCLGQYFSDIACDDVGREFMVRFPHSQAFTQQNTDMISHNLFDLLALVYQLLYGDDVDMNMAKIIMLQRAEGFKGEAVEIDFAYYIENQEMVLNPLSVLRSCMQWQLHGISQEQLAFSLIVCMAKFYVTYLEHVCQDVDQVLLSGSMLAFAPFFDVLMDALPTRYHYTLPYALALDCIKSTSKWYN